MACGSLSSQPVAIPIAHGDTHVPELPSITAVSVASRIAQMTSSRSCSSARCSRIWVAI